MPTRELGKSGLKVTPIIFGAWAVGGWMWGGTDDQQSIDAIRASLDAGVTTIDTAAVYGMGLSETLVGRAIAGYPRDKVIIATKCGLRWDDPEGAGVEPWNQKTPEGRDVVIRKNSRPASIAWEVEQSLKRLNTDYIDLYQIHRPDPSTPIEDSAAAMEKLRKAGKVRAIGVSNYDVVQMKQAMKAAPLSSLQPPYSVLRRGIEQEILPFCRENQIGVIVYSPLERGLLTGKVTPDRKFPAGDHRNEHKLFTIENRRKIIAALELIRPITDRYKVDFAQVIINYTIQVPGITAALVGARSVEQAMSNAHAMTFTLAPEELQLIRQAFDPLVV